MTNTKTELKEEKIKVIRTYSDGDLLSFIDEIRGKDNRTLLKQLLDFFVPGNLRNTKNDAEKYGIKTKQLFLKKFKNDNSAANKIRKNIDNKLQDSATKIYADIYMLWLMGQSGINRYIESFDNIHFGSKDFIEQVVEGCRKKKYPKEIVEKFYKFSPFIDIDATLELNISTLKFQYIDYIDQLEKEQQSNAVRNEKLKKVEQSRLELTEKIKSIEKQNKELVNNLERTTEEYENIKEKNEHFVVKINQQEEEIESINKENALLKNENNKLQKEIEKINNISNPLKMKESLQNKIEELNNTIKDKEKEIEYLKYCTNTTSSQENVKNTGEYLDLKHRYERLTNLRMKEIDKEIQEDKKLQQILLSMILNNSAASKLVIKHLNLKEEVINVGYDYYDNEMMNKRIELKELQKQEQELRDSIKTLKDEKNVAISSINLIQQNNIQKNSAAGVCSSYTYDSKTNGIELSAIFSHLDDGFVKKFTTSKFIIMDENKFKQHFDLSSIKIPVCNVIVETNWHSYEDWFGKYDNGIFHPAKTMVSDYYKFVKTSSDLPFGLIIFNKFNKILPEIYLQPFIESMEQIKRFNLIHPSEIKEKGEFATIENLPNLKYIMLSTNDENSFRIPKFFEKYII